MTGAKKTHSDFPALHSELRAREAVFRRRFSQQMLNEKPPFVYAALSGDGIIEDRETAWKSLFAGEVSEEETLEKMTCLMERYYSKAYPLDREWQH